MDVVKRAFYMLAQSKMSSFQLWKLGEISTFGQHVDSKMECLLKSSLREDKFTCDRCVEFGFQFKGK